MLKVEIQSFSFKFGSVPKGPEWAVIDCRVLTNPYAVPMLRNKTGMHKAVQDFVKEDARHTVLLEQGWAAAQEGKKIAFGCIGGQHRSVTMAELMADLVRKFDGKPIVDHTELKKGVQQWP